MVDAAHLPTIGDGSLPETKSTLNRFPLFGLFIYRAVRNMGYAEEEARLLGYSTAVLYAIFKAKSKSKEKKPEKETKKELPEAIKNAKTETITFGGQKYMVVYFLTFKHYRPNKRKTITNTLSRLGWQAHGKDDRQRIPS